MGDSGLVGYRGVGSNHMLECAGAGTMLLKVDVDAP